MMTMFKRKTGKGSLAIAMLALAMAASLVLAACGGASGGGAAATTTTAAAAANAGGDSGGAAAETTAAPAAASLKAVKLTVLYPGDITPRMTSFLAGEFGERMKEELNITMEVNYSPWTDYTTKLDLMLSSGEPLDWFWDGPSNFATRLAKKQVVQLDTLLQNQGQDILRMIPEENWRATTTGGKIMAIPSQAMPQGDKFYTILARTDLMDKVGVKEFKTLEEFDELLVKMHEALPEITMFSGDVFQSLVRWYGGDKHMRIDNYIYVIENEEGGQAYSIMDNKELIKQINNKMAEWNSLGYIPEKLLTERGNNVTRYDNGNYAFMAGAILRPQERLPSVKKNAPDAQLREFSLGDQPRYKQLASNEFIYITPQCVDAERTMMFLNWIYQSEEHFLFTIYGVEGKDWELNDDGSIERLSKDDLWYDWMFNNIAYAKFSSDVNPDFVKDLQTWEDGAKLSKLFGFTFDSTSIKSEVAQLSSLWEAKVYPLIDGFVDFDENYDAVLAELKAAGLDTYVNTYTEQLTAYLDASK